MLANVPSRTRNKSASNTTPRLSRRPKNSSIADWSRNVLGMQAQRRPTKKKTVQPHLVLFLLATKHKLCCVRAEPPPTPRNQLLFLSVFSGTMVTSLASVPSTTGCTCRVVVFADSLCWQQGTGEGGKGGLSAPSSPVES